MNIAPEKKTDTSMWPYMMHSVATCTFVHDVHCIAGNKSTTHTPCNVIIQ
jgi:hypothetical protein